MFRRDEGDGNPHDVVLEKLLAAGEMFRCRAIRENGKRVLDSGFFPQQQNAQG